LKNNGQFQPESINSIADKLKPYFSFWPLYVVLTVMGLIFSFTYLKYTKPVYLVSGKILVKDDKKGAEISSMLSSMEMLNEKKIAENEVEYLKSTKIMEEVVKDLKLYATVHVENNFRDDALYGDYCPVSFTATNPYGLHSINGPIAFKINWKKRQVSMLGKKFGNGDRVVLNGQDTLIVSFNDQKKGGFQTANKLYSLTVSNLYKQALGLQQKIKVVNSSKLSSIIDFKLETTQPKMGEDILNSLFKNYQILSLKDKNLAASNTLEFLETRLTFLTKELDNIESNIENFKSNNGIVALSAQAGMFLDQLKEHDQAVMDIDLKLSVLAEIKKYVLGKGSNPGIVPSLMGINEPILDELLKRLYATELEYGRLKNVTGAQNNELLKLKKDIDQLKPDILENIANINATLLSTKNTLLFETDKTKALLNNMPEKEKQLLKIQRQMEIKNAIYNYLLNKREETEITFASAVLDSQIIESGKSGLSPIKPQKITILLSGLLMGFVSGFAFVYFKMLLNDKIISKTDLEGANMPPFIGEVIFNKNESNVIIGPSTRTLIAEQIRNVRSNLAFFGTETDKKSILVTSSIPTEGKTFISVN
jgi:uncharacterized protein involved in exopolysaccharide biosynthesis